VTHVIKANDAAMELVCFRPIDLTALELCNLFINSAVQQLVSIPHSSPPVNSTNGSSYYASKQCTYTDASGRSVPAPRPFRPEKQDSQPSSSSDNRLYSSPQFNPVSDPSRFSNQLRIYNNPSSSLQTDSSDDDHKHSRKRFRNGRGNPMSVEDLTIEGPISGVSIDRPTSIELDPSLTRELTNCKKFFLLFYKFHLTSFISVFHPLSSRSSCHTQANLFG